MKEVVEWELDKADVLALKKIKDERKIKSWEEFFRLAVKGEINVSGKETLVIRGGQAIVEGVQSPEISAETERILPIAVTNLRGNITVAREIGDITGLLCGTEDKNCGNAPANEESCASCNDFSPLSGAALVVGRDASDEELKKANGFDGDVFLESHMLGKTEFAPEYVVFLDPLQGPEILEGIDTKAMTGLFEACVDPRIIASWEGPKKFFISCMPQLDFPNVSHTMHLLTRCIVMNSYGFEGGCWSIAEYLGHKPIHMAGARFNDEERAAFDIQRLRADSLGVKTTMGGEE